MINIKIISILTLSLILTSCGFKKLNQKDGDVIYIQNISVVGDQRIANTLKNDIRIISNSGAQNRYNIELKVQKNKTIKIKNKSGKITRYNLTIIADLQLIDVDGEKKLQKTFARNGNYQIAKSHSDTINNENKTTKNIVQQLSSDIISYIIMVARN